MKKNKALAVFGAAVLVLAIFGLGAYFWGAKEAKETNERVQNASAELVRDYSPRLGPDNAKVTLVEFMDPECESCAAFFPHVKELLRKYPNDLQLVIRYAPFHKNSVLAIRILEVSREFGKYEQLMAKMFKNISEWGDHHNPRPELLWDYVADVGMDVEKVRDQINDPKYEEIIMQDYRDLQELGVRGTPSFFVNGSPLQEFGVKPLQEAIRKAINN